MSGPTMPQEFILSPAYGRDYGSAQSVRRAWQEGADFLIRYPFDAPTYINRADWLKYGGGGPVWIRYDDLTIKVQVEGS
jgi:hypothetical protein